MDTELLLKAFDAGERGVLLKAFDAGERGFYDCDCEICETWDNIREHRK